MIDTAAIVITSLLVLFIAVRATILDAKERSGTDRGDTAAPSEDET